MISKQKLRWARRLSKLDPLLHRIPAWVGPALKADKEAKWAKINAQNEAARLRYWALVHQDNSRRGK